MYSHYISGIFSPLRPHTSSGTFKKSGSAQRNEEKLQTDGLSSGIQKVFDEIHRIFSVEGFDFGDILMMLIILLLIFEGDNLELVITLGLMILLD